MLRFRRTPKVRITSLAKDFSTIPEVDWYFREKSSPHDLSMGMEQLLQKDKAKALAHLQVLAKKGNDKAQMVAIEHLQQEGVKPIAKNLLRLANSTNHYAQWRSMQLLGELGVKSAIPLLTKAVLSSQDPLVRNTAFHALDKLGVNSKLYQGKNLDPNFTHPKNGGVPRVMQGKTHQSTTLLGGRLFNRALIKGKRTPDHPKGYSADQLMYWLRSLNHDWKRAGWKYNPVEPILQKPNGRYRYSKNKDGSYRVSVGVVKGQNAASFLLTNSTEKEKKFVLDQMDRITKELKSIGVYYAHPKPDNFIVQKKLGRPRVYVIDFDYVWGVNETQKINP